MKKLIMICALVTLMSAFGSTAKADNPANWYWSLETHGTRDDDGPLSPPVDLGYSVYNYEGQLTHVEGDDPWPALEVANTIWVDIWDWIPDDEKSGSGSHDGWFPFIDELILHIEHPEITADFLFSVDAGGYGTISIANITFGQVEYEGHYYDVTGARFQGDVTITPEPTTFVLLGTAGLWILTRKRRLA